MPDVIQEPQESDEDVAAVPDELLLELMDLVTLSFPQPLYEMVISFQPTPDGTRPALTNLDGKALPHMVKRPALGHSDNAVLDAVNALLADFADATQLQGNVRVLDGKIVMTDGPDGDRFVELRDARATGDGHIAMSRRFDKSELRWLFWTAPLFRLLEETAAKESAQKRDVDAALVPFVSFKIDMQQGTIAFSAAPPATPSKTWSFELLGSWSDATKRFMWGWANQEVPARIKKRSDAVRAASTDEGLRALIEPDYGCPEPCADRLVRHVAARMDAFGVYRAPFTSSQGKGFMYLALLRDGATG